MTFHFQLQAVELVPAVALGGGVADLPAVDEFKTPHAVRVTTGAGESTTTAAAAAAAVVVVFTTESDDERQAWLAALGAVPGCPLTRETRSPSVVGGAAARPPPPPPRSRGASAAPAPSPKPYVDLRRVAADDSTVGASPSKSASTAAAPPSPISIAAAAPASTPAHVSAPTASAPPPAVRAADVFAAAAAAAAARPATLPPPASYEATASATTRLRQGYLEKIGDIAKSWKKRWCTITGPTLCYYKDPSVRFERVLCRRRI